MLFRTEYIYISGAPHGDSRSPIHFAVPSMRVLQRESDKYKVNVSSPGIIHDSLDAFSAIHPNKEVKLSIDGKKIAYGYGKKLGEEDLGGFEEEPKLEERKAELNSEIKTVESLCQRLNVCEKNLNSITDKASVINDLKKLVNSMSNRIKILRTLSVKKKRYVEYLMQQVTGDWRKSKLANAISFVKTQLIKVEICIHHLLECIDDVSFWIAVLHGSAHDYRRGLNIEIDLNHQSNFICLLDGQRDTGDYSNPNLIKQRSSQWHDLRSNAKVTGSTLFKALGCATLSDQKRHFEKVFEGKEETVSPELQAKFNYGTENEVNALATLLCKIMPVYYPSLTYQEDGCVVLPLDLESHYAVISGDGTGINQEKNETVAFELKCPIPEKKYTPDVYYELPVRYSTQVLSQMAAKECGKYANICFTSQSTTFMEGKFNSPLWEEAWTFTKELYGAQADKKKPTKRLPKSGILLSKVKDFSRQSRFVAEVPSVKGLACSCPKKEGNERPHGHHETMGSIEFKDLVCCDRLDECKEQIQTAYDLLRRPAKELLLTVVSDLDRTVNQVNPESPHAVPVM